MIVSGAVVLALVCFVIAWRLHVGRRTNLPQPLPEPFIEEEAAPVAGRIVAPAVPVTSAVPETAEGPLTRAQIFTRLAELAFGVAPLRAPNEEEFVIIERGARAVLEKVASEPRYAPRRPLLLPQLMRAVNDDEISGRELARIIARDPSLAGSLLKLANSSFYKVSDRPVESVDRAVAVLGMNGLRSLLATVLMQPVFRLNAAQFARFPEIAWEHTYRSAAAAEAHAAIVEDNDPFAAQLLGLTFGLGTIVIFRVALDQYAARPGGKPKAAVIFRLLQRHAAPVARSIAASWELTDRILDALADQDAAPDVRPATALGRSLLFGRLTGALALLYSQKLISEPTAKSSILATGASASHFERIWGRLTLKPVAGEPVRGPGGTRIG